jgi:hypothetical protein
VTSDLAVRVPLHVELGRAVALATRCAQAVALPLLLLAILQCCLCAWSLGWGRAAQICGLVLVLAKPLIAARVLRSFARAEGGIVAPAVRWTDVVSVAITVGWPLLFVNGIFAGLLFVTADPMVYQLVATIGMVAASCVWVFAVWAFTLHLVDGVELDRAITVARTQVFPRGLGRTCVFAAIVSLPKIFVASVSPTIAAPDSATPAVGLAAVTAVLWLGDAFSYALFFVSRPQVALDPALSADAVRQP